MAAIENYKKNGSRVIFVTLLFFILVMVTIVDGRYVKIASASSAMVSVKSSAQNVQKGESFYVIITVKSSDAIGGFVGAFSYDSRKMQYVTGGTVSSGNDDEFLIADTGRETEDTTIKYSVKFFARKNGKAEVFMKPSSVVYASGGEETMSVSSNRLEISLGKKKPSKKKNENAVATPLATRQETALPQPTPTVKETKKPKKNDNQDEKFDQLENSVSEWKDSLSVVEKKSGTMLKAQESYTLVSLEDETLIPEGFGKTEQNIDGKVVPAYASEKDTVHDYLLFYCKHGKQSPTFYLYGKKEGIFVPYSSVKEWYQEKENGIKVQDKGKSSVSWGIVSIVLFLVNLILLISVVLLGMRLKENQVEDDIERRWQEEFFKEDFNQEKKYK